DVRGDLVRDVRFAGVPVAQHVDRGAAVPPGVLGDVADERLEVAARTVQEDDVLAVLGARLQRPGPDPARVDVGVPVVDVGQRVPDAHEETFPWGSMTATPMPVSHSGMTS